jgi:hypothetical protein
MVASGTENPAKDGNFPLLILGALLIKWGHIMEICECHAREFSSFGYKGATQARGRVVMVVF